MTFGNESSFHVGEPMIDGVLEIGDGSVAALGHLVVLEVAEDRLDVTIRYVPGTVVSQICSPR